MHPETSTSIRANYKYSPLARYPSPLCFLSVFALLRSPIITPSFVFCYVYHLTRILVRGGNGDVLQW
jgi:hypothetical protein